MRIKTPISSFFARIVIETVLAVRIRPSNETEVDSHGYNMVGFLHESLERNEISVLSVVYENENHV